MARYTGVKIECPQSKVEQFAKRFPGAEIIGGAETTKAMDFSDEFAGDALDFANVWKEVMLFEAYIN